VVVELFDDRMREGVTEPSVGAAARRPGRESLLVGQASELVGDTSEERRGIAADEQALEVALGVVELPSGGAPRLPAHRVPVPGGEELVVVGELVAAALVVDDRWALVEAAGDGGERGDHGGGVAEVVELAHHVVG